MGKLKTSSCPRCENGEIFIDRDHYGWFECCLQCGYGRDLPDIILSVPAGDQNAAEEPGIIYKRRSKSRRKKS